MNITSILVTTSYDIHKPEELVHLERITSTMRIDIHHCELPKQLLTNNPI